MRLHSAMATLEPQKYVIAVTVGTENKYPAGQRASCSLFHAVQTQDFSIYDSMTITKNFVAGPFVVKIFLIKNFVVGNFVL